MIQVIGLRPFKDKDGKEKKKHVQFTEVESVPLLFENIDKIIEEIPASERWNVYFTALDCQDPRTVKGQLRRFKSQEIFPFDIDGIDQTKQQNYIDVFFAITGFASTKTVVICSGNGLQFFAQFDKPFTDPSYFEEKRFQYKAICERVDKRLAELGIPGRADPSVWTPARLMRLINTENRKPNKDPKKAFYISGKLEPQTIDWGKLSGVAEIAVDEHVEWNDSRAPKLDHKEIYHGCSFLKSTIENPETIREPHYYAALSVIARMENGRDRAHKLAESIRDSNSDSTVTGYSHADIEKKIDQAMAASGPRTCKSINAIWGKCSKCPNFGKIASPVSLKGVEHIATKDTGFHVWKEGKPTPHYKDLLKFFDQEFSHKTLDTSGLVYIWKNNKYDLMSEYQIKNFAESHFNPSPKSAVVQEFYSLVRRTNLVNAEFFGADLSGFINFQNGVLDVKKKEIIPHTPNRGFRYILPYGYDPAATAPRFDLFLDEVTGGDKDIRKVLEEFGGYALSGDDYWSHHCLLLLGEGRNGKSKYLEALQMAAGKDNYSTTKLEKFGSQNDLQLMEGMLFNVSEEISHKEMKLTETLKDLSSGNTMTVKLMWHQPYKIKNKAKIILTANKLPATTDMSVAFFDRMIMVPFDQYYGGANKDPHLAEKFKKELPGIFNIFLSGYDRLVKQQTFTNALLIDEEKSDYAEEINPVFPWFDERRAHGKIVVNPVNGKCDFVFVSDLYTDFCIWNQTHGNIVRLSLRDFSYNLGALFKDAKVRKGRNRQWLCSGSKGPHLAHQRWGFYDVLYNPDTAQQNDSH